MLKIHLPTLCPVPQRGESVSWQSATALFFITANPILERDLGEFREPIKSPSDTLQVSTAKGLRSSWTQLAAHGCGGLSSPGKGQRRRREAGPGISINPPNTAVGWCKQKAAVRTS